MGILFIAVVLAGIACFMLMARRERHRQADPGDGAFPFADGGIDGAGYDHHDSGGFDGGDGGFHGGDGGDAAGGGDSGAGGDGGGGDGGGH